MQSMYIKNSLKISLQHVKFTGVLVTGGRVSGGVCPNHHPAVPRYTEILSELS